jgi:hypothetical protein
MRQARDAAWADEASINPLLVAFIAEGLGHRRGLGRMRDRAARAEVDAVLAILDKVPDVPP